MSPKELRELADRIDFDRQWARPGMDRIDGKMTPEERDRCDAGIMIRRHAAAREKVLERLKEGAEYIRGYKLTRAGFGTDRFGCGDREWHVAINEHADACRRSEPKKAWPAVMYLAKSVADEVPRMILLFEAERKAALPKAFKLCAHDPKPATPLPDNHLRCALGVECRKCEMLGAIDAAERMTPEAKDEAKAWTCAVRSVRRCAGAIAV